MDSETFLCPLPFEALQELVVWNTFPSLDSDQYPYKQVWKEASAHIPGAVQRRVCNLLSSTLIPPEHLLPAVLLCPLIAQTEMGKLLLFLWMLGYFASLFILGNNESFEAKTGQRTGTRDG